MEALVPKLTRRNMVGATAATVLTTSQSTFAQETQHNTGPVTMTDMTAAF